MKKKAHSYHKAILFIKLHSTNSWPTNAKPNHAENYIIHLFIIILYVHIMFLTKKKLIYFNV